MNLSVPGDTANNGQSVLTERFRGAACGIAVFCVATGLLMMAGATYNARILITLNPRFGSIKITTAICITLAGLSLLILAYPPLLRSHRRVAIAIASCVTFAGFVTLIDHLFGLDLTIDNFLATHGYLPPQPVPTQPMAHSTSLNFMLAGLALLLVDVRIRGRLWPSQFVCLTFGLLSLVAFVGRLYGVEYLFRLGTDAQVALYSAVTFLALAVGILCARPDRGMMAVVSSDSDSGIMARRLLPAAFSIPLILGALALQPAPSTLTDPAFRLSLLIVSHVVIFTLLIWWDVTFIYRLDVERRRAEEGLRRYADRLQSLLEIGKAIIDSQGADETAETTLIRLRRQLACPWSAAFLFDFPEEEANVLAIEADPRFEEAIADEITRELAGSRGPGPFRPEGSFPLAFIPAPHVAELQSGEIATATCGTATQPVAEADRTKVTQRSIVDVLHECGLHHLLIVPLRAREALLGCVILGRTGDDEFGEESVGVAREVTDRLSLVIQQWRLFEQLRASRTQLQILSHRLMQAQEMERRTLARELHDEIGQEMTAIRLSLQMVQRLLDAEKKDPQQLQTFVSDGIGIAETVLQQVRNLSLELRPSLLDDLGLVAALRWYADRQAQRAGLEVNVIATGFRARVPPEIETACFRVTQEALTNIVRHARAHRVNIELHLKPASTRGSDDSNGHSQEQVELTIRDDGIGFDVRAARQKAVRGESLGLLGMEERVGLSGGQISLTSSSDRATAARGTIIRATFPIPYATVDQLLSAELSVASDPAAHEKP